MNDGFQALTPAMYMSPVAIEIEPKAVAEGLKKAYGIKSGRKSSPASVPLACNKSLGSQALQYIATQAAYKPAKGGRNPGMCSKCLEPVSAITVSTLKE